MPHSTESPYQAPLAAAAKSGHKWTSWQRRACFALGFTFLFMAGGVHWFGSKPDRWESYPSQQALVSTVLLPHIWIGFIGLVLLVMSCIRPLWFRGNVNTAHATRLSRELLPLTFA